MINTDEVRVALTSDINLLLPGTSMVRDCPSQDITVPLKSSGLLTVATTLMIDELNSVTLKITSAISPINRVEILDCSWRSEDTIYSFLDLPTGVHSHSNTIQLTVHLYMASPPGQEPFSTTSSPGTRQHVSLSSSICTCPET